ncbi:uncharacterized protein EV420DRAFT_1507073 [Desarmillaria tabescens]|uniref:Uncharacterized protein n=1 Tax=Armillaria tabescens TaxID=1929756 RepID=A0AA39NJZ4_ARMTA|nr:uncharacterized protein EV420DRAFT_1507073 [Desarmillaria tabescens]KAK0467077.1 hypothetical protein EV420DRAFT_1507073 [Desarmillaria tabescens]
MSFRLGHALDIVVCIVYKPDKATRLLDAHLKDLAMEMRKDLDAMKMPHPPEANIRPPTLEGIVFSWTTRKYSPLYNIIHQTADHQDDDMMEYKKTKDLCSIDKIIVSEGPPTDFEKLSKPSTGKRVLDLRFPRSQSDTTQTRSSADQRRESLASNFDQRVKEYEDACRAVTVAANQESMPRSQSTSQEPAVRKPPAPVTFVPASKTSTDQFLAFFPDAVRAAPTEPPPKDPAPPPENEQVSSLMREYWDTRRKMTAIIAQAEMVEERLERMGVIQPLGKRSTADLPKLLAKAQLDLLRERAERSHMANVLEDVERECKSPVIVPELLRAVIHSIV